MGFRLHRTTTLTLAAVGLAASVLSLLPSRAWALRISQPTQGLRVQVHSLWNPLYLCLAAKVADLMITGSSVSPMSAPQQDDAIEFDFEVPTAAGPEAHRLIISAAGGMTVLVRDTGGRWRPDPSWISGTEMLKYAVSVEGTVNNPADTDTGYTIECAIPWKFLGGEPPIDKEIGFNVIAWMQGESEGMVSWSPTVLNEGDIGDATRWGRMLLAAGANLAVAEGNYLPSPFNPRIPFIDGKLNAEEWMTASTLIFEKPAPTLQPVAAPSKQADMIGTLLAVYRYDWQGDPARPGAHFWEEGRPATSDQPKEGVGPWYSYERVGWHRAQLNEIQRAGIDIILPRYLGDEKSRTTWARVGLDRLAEALKTMRAEGHSYPLVGMMLDTGPLAGADLKSDDGKRLIYAMVRDFFLHIPREFWAELDIRPDKGLTGAAPILLGEPDGLTDWDASFLAFCQERFARDFGGARIVWLGSAQWRSRGVDSFYAYVRLPAGVGLTQEASGGVSAVALSPGYCPSPGTIAEIRPRRDGRAYRSDWQRVLASAPELVVLSSWNDFAKGDDLAPSRQYGVTYADATRFFSARLGSRQPHALRLRKEVVPRTLRPGASYRTEFLVENVGTEDIRSGRRVSADYRIVRRADGKTMQSRSAAQDLSIMAGQTLRLPVVITAKDDRGEPLAPGEYLFSLVAVRSTVAYLRSNWFAKPVAELTVPITVGQPPARKATVISTSLPSSIESGAAERVVVRIRNDGLATWRAADTALSYHWLRHDDRFGAGQVTEAMTRVAGGTAREKLPKDIPPGEVISVIIAVTAKLDDGSPLPVIQASDLMHYRVQWDLTDKAGWFAAEAAPSEAMDVIARDRGVLFESANTPTTMQARDHVKVDIIVANAGPRAWSAANSYLTYAWYRWDGRPIADDAVRTRITADVAPGQRTLVVASLAAPSAPGPYWLVWDMAPNGESYSAECGRRADLLVTPVMVRSSSFRAVDLSKFTNVIAVTDDAHRSRGDFDGQGRSFPAEWLPPDQSGAADKLYPSGYYSPFPSASGAPFAFPDMSSGVGGAVACAGQSIPLGGKGASRVHLLLAATGEASETALGMKLADGSVEQAPVTVPLWRGAASASQTDVGAFAPYVRTLTSDDPTAAASLYDRTVAPASARAVSLELPQNPSVKVMAITIEE